MSNPSATTIEGSTAPRPSSFAPEDPDCWRPQLLDASAPSCAPDLQALLDSGAASFVHDTLWRQLLELVEARAPGETLSPEEARQHASALLAGCPPSQFGRWVFYPWSRRLVHLLPPQEFSWLRENRNRNKITEAEARRLRTKSIGVVGLSVGQSTALTLAMEGVCGELRLADLDTLDLSNLNRLRAPVHAIGVNKAVLAARQIAELDPYLPLRVFSEGLNEDNSDAFLQEGGALDLLIEECDDLFLKIDLRERARRAGIPVLMETSDRGLVDLERFDLEPERPLLHGLLGDLQAASLKGLSTYDKVPIVLRLLGEDAISPRLAASMVEIDSSLKTWPQLASAVSLGAALGCDLSRRLLLGEALPSGRHYVDLETLIPPSTTKAAQPVPSPSPEASTEAAHLPEPQLTPDTQDPGLSHAIVRALVEFAVQAPSGGNCQPWRFSFDGVALSVWHDPERSASFLDFGDRAAFLALGAAVESMWIAAPALGLHLKLAAPPTMGADGDPRLACRLLLRPQDLSRAASAMVLKDPLFDALSGRCTNRRSGVRERFDPAFGRRLVSAAQQRGASLCLVDAAAVLDSLGRNLGCGDRIRFLHRAMHQELISELRWSPQEARESRDGMDVATLELTPTDLAGMKLTRGWRVMELVGRVGGGRALEKNSVKAMQAASAAGLITFPGRSTQSYFEAGRALQRVWLEATASGWSLQPMTAITYLFERLQEGGEGLADSERSELEALWRAHQAIFDTQPGEAQAMLFRLHKAGPPSERSLRRPVEEVLSFQ